MTRNVKGVRTLEQLKTKKAQAASFVRNILKDENRAKFIESESLEEYAERKKFRIKNTKKENMSDLRKKINRLKKIEAKTKDLIDNFYKHLDTNKKKCFFCALNPVIDFDLCRKLDALETLVNKEKL